MTIPQDTAYIPLPDKHFHPTLAYYLHASKSYSKSVLNLTTHLLPIEHSVPEAYIDNSVLERAKTLQISSDVPEPIYNLHKENLLGTHYLLKDTAGNEVAEWKSGILSFGKTSFKFPQGSEHAGEEFDIKPVSAWKRVENFVKDGVTYTWDVEKSHHEHRTLSKVVDGEKVEVARYAQKHPHDKEGLLLVNGKEVDEMVAVLTLCAVLEVKDSFAAPVPWEK